MNEEEVKMLITGKLVEIYGFADGPRTAGILLPGILADFRKMTAASPEGAKVHEEYNTEDRKVRIQIAGCRIKNRTIFDTVSVEKI